MIFAKSTTLLLGLAVLAPEAEGSADVSLDGGGVEASSEGTKPKDRGDQPWIRRWAPERNMLELGVFGGVMFPHPRLELFEPDPTQPDQGFEALESLAPEVGGRAGFYPLRFLGVEGEGAWLPTQTESGAGANMWVVRGHLVAQVARWSITPFAVAGASGLAIASDSNAVGNDVDLGFHFGGGLKFFFNRYVMARLDVRDTMTARRGLGLGVVHSPEVLLGISVTLNRKKSPPPPDLDRDDDGILDVDDKCIDVPGVPEYDGCPIPDTDGDGILDPDDKCVDEPGVPEYDGCPIPDTDGDGIYDPDDKCVDEPGVPEYDGCPIPDTDGDGILDPDDKCVDEPETVNQFEDEDGCPDKVPEKIKAFTGVIEGIYFDTAKSTIKKKSEAKLDKAVAVLKEFPKLRIEISGHTDDRGNDAYNKQLSADRAESVKAYLVAAGVDGSRIETRGAGEEEPRESYDKKAGRAKNRRIEFKLLK
jgi:outer membrane protein OmpA-like peptidoglycan-associated protein